MIIRGTLATQCAAVVSDVDVSLKLGAWNLVLTTEGDDPLLVWPVARAIGSRET